MPYSRDPFITPGDWTLVDSNLEGGDGTLEYTMPLMPGTTAYLFAAFVGDTADALDKDTVIRIFLRNADDLNISGLRNVTLAPDRKLFGTPGQAMVWAVAASSPLTPINEIPGADHLMLRIGTAVEPLDWQWEFFRWDPEPSDGGGGDPTPSPCPDRPPWPYEEPHIGAGGGDGLTLREPS